MARKARSLNLATAVANSLFEGIVTSLVTVLNEPQIIGAKVGLSILQDLVLGRSEVLSGGISLEIHRVELFFSSAERRCAGKTTLLYTSGSAPGAPESGSFF